MRTIGIAIMYLLAVAVSIWAGLITAIVLYKHVTPDSVNIYGTAVTFCTMLFLSVLVAKVFEGQKS